MKRTRWRPDTCGCDIEYEWDETVPLASRTHTGVVIHNLCPDHAAATVASAHFALLGDENSRKNVGLGLLKQQAELGESTIVDGETVMQFKAGVTVSWHYNESRVLIVSIFGTSLTAGRQNQIQSAADSLFGAGKVELIWT